MTEPITQFTGCYRFLSNFYPSIIEGIDGHRYVTVEHAYQAAKCANKTDALRIRRTLKPAVAKHMGVGVARKGDFMENRVTIMRSLVLKKFANIQHLKEKLLATGNAELSEGNYWGDRFWGVCKGEGENHLGKILMQVRKELRDGKPD